MKKEILICDKCNLESQVNIYTVPIFKYINNIKFEERHIELCEEHFLEYKNDVINLFNKYTLGPSKFMGQ